MAIEPDSRISGKGASGENSPGGGEAIVEIAAILAVAHQRLTARKSSQKSGCGAKTLLDCAGQHGGDVARKAQEVAP